MTLSYNASLVTMTTGHTPWLYKTIHETLQTSVLFYILRKGSEDQVTSLHSRIEEPHWFFLLYINKVTNNIFFIFIDFCVLFCYLKMKAKGISSVLTPLLPACSLAPLLLCCFANAVLGAHGNRWLPVPLLTPPPDIHFTFSLLFLFSEGVERWWQRLNPKKRHEVQHFFKVKTNRDKWKSRWFDGKVERQVK